MLHAGWATGGMYVYVRKPSVWEKTAFGCIPEMCGTRKNRFQ